MCRNINIRQRLCENLIIKNIKLFIPVANCKIFQEFFGRFANIVLPLLWHHAQIMLWLSLMIVWVYPWNVMTSVSTCLSQSTGFNVHHHERFFLSFFKCIDQVCLIVAPLSISQLLHLLAVFISVAASAKYSTSAAWLHNPTILFLLSLKPKTLLWLSFLVNNLPNMWMWSCLKIPKAAAHHLLTEEQL